jgi:hypothetical protein
MPLPQDIRPVFENLQDMLMRSDRFSRSVVF